MAQEPIVCPHCKGRIELTQVMSSAIEAKIRRDLEAEAGARRAEDERRRQDLDLREAKAREEAAAAKRAMTEAEERVRSLLAAERLKVQEQARRDAVAQAAAESELAIRAAKEDAERIRMKLTEAQKAELAWRQERQAFEDTKRSFELDKQREIEEAKAALLERARRDATEEARLTLASKDKVIDDLKRLTEDLKRKAEQGSQQLQGEVLELDLEASLRAAFPRDTVEPVAKGAFGGDAVQRVLGSGVATVGTILWESKRTKTWSDGWLAKLRSDQRTAKADIAVLVTSALPKGVEQFGQVDGVWVCAVGVAVPLACVLRQALIDVAGARASAEGVQTKMELVYRYLTGPGFKQRVEAIVEAFTTMREDLETEKKFVMRQWAKRDMQIANVLASTMGMHGDLQGIAGGSVPEIAGLEVVVPDRSLESGAADRRG
ncbi:MAG: DUF2130 domain-containing protein [Tepidisphaera sp.]